MKKIFKIVLVLSLCFFIKAQAQKAKWTQEERNQVEQEVSWINEVVPLNDPQTNLLSEILLEKNQMIAENLRVEWGKKIVLSRIEDILRYGQEINRHPGEENIDTVREILSEKEFKEKIGDNRALLEKLNLNTTED